MKTYADAVKAGEKKSLSEATNTKIVLYQPIRQRDHLTMRPGKTAKKRKEESRRRWKETRK